MVAADDRTYAYNANRVISDDLYLIRGDPLGRFEPRFRKDGKSIVERLSAPAPPVRASGYGSEEVAMARSIKQTHLVVFVFAAIAGSTAIAGPISGRT